METRLRVCNLPCTRTLCNLCVVYLALKLCHSGPKRYDVIDGRWRYAHSGEALYDRLHQEFSEILGVDLDMSQLKHSHIMSDPENWAH